MATLILAGGKSRRMNGQDKAFVMWRGQTLLDHALAHAFGENGPVFISSNRDPDRFAESGVPVLPDPVGFEFAGPLAGILAGLEAVSDDHLLVLPVDTPRLPPGLPERLKSAGAGIAVASFSGQTQQVLGLWQRSEAKGLRAYLENGKRTVLGYLEEAGGKIIDFDFEGPNLNRPEDLQGD